MRNAQQYRQVVVCACCGERGPKAGRGLIRVCYMRHRKQGTLDQFGRERQPASPEGARVVVCVCCGVEGPVKGRGLIYACYDRHYNRGTLDRYPLGESSMRRAHEARAQAHASQVEEYVWLRGMGETPEQALTRIGLKPAMSTVRRYEGARQAVAS